MTHEPTQGPPGDRLYSLERTAAMLGISARTLERLVARGAVRSVKLGGRRMFEADIVRAFIESAREGEGL